MKILIVDDEPLFLDLMEHTLHDLGYRDVDLASSAEHALQLVQGASRPYDCFLLDIQMPGMNGISLCSELRERPVYARTPVVMVTAMTEKHYIDQAFQAGASDYVTKPIDSIEIKARMGMVETLLSERVQTGALNLQLQETEVAFGRQTSFDEPFALPDVPWVLPLSSLENYVLRLGNLRMISNVAVGIHVRNAEGLYVRSKGVEFMDRMAEVAIAIGEVLPRSPSFLSYAGCGDFCAVIPRLTPLDPRFASMTINDTLDRLAARGLGKSDVPQVRIGRPQSNAILSFRDPSSVLIRAISDARTYRGEGKGHRNTYRSFTDHDA